MLNLVAKVKKLLVMFSFVVNVTVMIKCEKVVVAVALIVEKLSTTKTCFMQHWHSDIERTCTNILKHHLV